jgi:DNA polymerase I
MQYWDVRILTASYARENVVIELYGRTREEKSIVIRYEGFRPYFYLVDPPKSILDDLKKDGNVLKLEDCTLFVDGEDKKCVKVAIKEPWTVPEYRNELGRDCRVLAADIPFAQRFIYDLDLNSCVRVFGERIEGDYTTDLVVRADKFEECEPFKPSLKILSFDLENSIKNGTIYTICCAIKFKEKRFIERLSGNERDIIQDFVKVVQKYDPDVITGYNIDGYDIPTIIERSKQCGIRNLPFGRDFTQLRNVGGRFWRLHGRIIADAWWNVKREVKPKQETLNYVAKILLGERKEDVDPTKIDEEWKKDRDKVISYCLKDAELALHILEKIAVLNKSMDLATVSKLPVDDVINGRTSTLIDSILIREADRNKIGVPQTKHVRKREKIIGGYVHTIEPGLYHWVCVLDFKSMYPSVIISNNICFTTISDKGKVVSPTGIRFLDKGERLGLLPQILERLMNDRENVKRKRAESKDDDEIRYYDGLQNAIKTLMNAFYGVFASSFYRFTNPEIGGSITAFARENIKNVIDELENEDLTVIYGDTDSVFFSSPYDNLNDTINFGKEKGERFSKGGIVLEFEKVLEPFFSHGKKKRYVGNVVWPKKEMLVRGYEIRRTDAFDLQSDALNMVFKEIMKCDLDKAVKVAREMTTDVANGKVPIEKLVISRSCKSYNFYKNPDTQANVQAARKREKMGYEFVPGMKVSWIVTDGKKSPQIVEPFISGKAFEHKPDYNYYARRIAMTLARITEVSNWDEKSLLAGVQQSTLFGKDRSRSKKKERIKKTDKKLTLEDFM